MALQFLPHFLWVKNMGYKKNKLGLKKIFHISLQDYYLSSKHDLEFVESF